MKRTSKSLFMIPILFLLMTAISYGGLDIKEGLWEVKNTVEMDIPGATFKVPSRIFTYRECLTRQKIFPRLEDNLEKVCKIVNQRIEGSKVVWEMECKDRRSIAEGVGEIKYEGKRFEGNMTLVTHENGMTAPTRIVRHMEGHWIGRCK